VVSSLKPRAGGFHGSALTVSLNCWFVAGTTHPTNTSMKTATIAVRTMAIRSTGAGRT
jgi:hypothetical protein